MKSVSHKILWCSYNKNITKHGIGVRNAGRRCSWSRFVGPLICGPWETPYVVHTQIRSCFKGKVNLIDLASGKWGTRLVLPLIPFALYLLNLQFISFYHLSYLNLQFLSFSRLSFILSFYILYISSSRLKIRIWIPRRTALYSSLSFYFH